MYFVEEMDYMSQGGEYYLKGNYETIHIGRSPLQALCMLVKYCTLFSLEYDVDLHFFIVIVSNDDGLKPTIPNKISSFISKIMAIQ